MNTLAVRLLPLLLLLLLCAATLAAQDSDIETSLEDGLLHWRSEDGNYELSMYTATWFRWTYHDVRASGGSKPTSDNGRDFNNFRLPFVRTFFDGHILSPEFRYRFWIVFGHPVSPIRIEDATLTWAPMAEMNLTIGQMRTPYSWEYLVDHERAALVDRSIVDAAFSQSWAKGVSVSGSIDLYDVEYEPALLWYEVGIYNGVLASTDGAQGRGAIEFGGTNRSQGILITDTGGTEWLRGGFRNEDWGLAPDVFRQIVDADLMLAGRVEFHPMGRLPRHMVDFRSADEIADDKAWKMMVGLAGTYFNARVNGEGTWLGAIYHTVTGAAPLPLPPSGRDYIRAEMTQLTVDGHFRWLGFSINWAYHYRRTKFHNHGKARGRNIRGPGIVSGTTDHGGTVDLGYFILPEKLSISARIDVVNFDEFSSTMPITGQIIDGDAFGPDTTEFGGGFAWFIFGDNLKLMADYRYVVQQLPHGVGKGKDSTSGLERVSEFRNFQEVRVQVQWIF